MKKRFLINDIPVIATYSEILMQKLRQLLLECAKQKGRQILFLAAPCGAGKSTLAALIKELALAEKLDFQAAGMDGFHYPQQYLETHFCQEESGTVPLTHIKGAPQTFDFDALKAKLEDLRYKSEVSWPAYSRVKHDIIFDAQKLDAKIILIEGNYLLLDCPKWRDLAALADQTIFIAAPLELLKRRLILRRMASGVPLHKATPFVERSDLANAKLVLSSSLKADYRLQWDEEGNLEAVGW